MRHVFSYLSLCAVALAGCGAGGGSSEPVGPTEITVGAVPQSVTLTLNEETGIVLYRDEIRTVDLFEESADDVPGFIRYAGGRRSGVPFTQAFIGETSSGAGTVTAFSQGGTQRIGVFLERTGETTVPTGGTATFTGGYAGWMQREDGFDSGRWLSGEAELNMNFSTATVSGRITNRVDQSLVPFAGVTLEEGAIANGSFSGATSGGRSSLSGWTVEAGDYAGLLTGPNGEEVIGAVSIRQTSDTDVVYIETGGFIAE